MLNKLFKLLSNSESCSLARSMKASMESALIPVPLFRAAFRMVSHMFPVMWCDCSGVGSEVVGGKAGTGSEYRPFTILMLEESMVAMELEAQILLMAVL